MIGNVIRKVLPYRPIKVESAMWDLRYQEHKWDRIRSICESARYSLIVGYIHYLTNAARILDVGCGEGIIRERLCRCSYSRYMGIDVSTVAVERASTNNYDRDQFRVSRLEDFCTEEKFDVIIFNECLYYIEKPLTIIRRYETFLARDGLFIVSMHKNNESWKIWRYIDKSYSVKDAVSLKNANGACWIVKVLGVP